MTTQTFSSHEFAATMQGRVVAAYPMSERSATFSITEVEPATSRAISPAEAARAFWRWDVMPQTMQRLA